MPEDLIGATRQRLLKEADFCSGSCWRKQEALSYTSPSLPTHNNGRTLVPSKRPRHATASPMNLSLSQYRPKPASSRGRTLMHSHKQVSFPLTQCNLSCRRAG
jgi:hypothetical protein